MDELRKAASTRRSVSIQPLFTKLYTVELYTNIFWYFYFWLKNKNHMAAANMWSEGDMLYGKYVF